MYPSGMARSCDARPWTCHSGGYGSIGVDCRSRFWSARASSFSRWAQSCFLPQEGNRWASAPWRTYNAVEARHVVNIDRCITVWVVSRDSTSYGCEERKEEEVCALHCRCCFGYDSFLCAYEDAVTAIAWLGDRSCLYTWTMI